RSRTRRTPSPFSRFSRRSTCSRSSRSRVSYNTSRPMPSPGDTQAPELAGPPSAGPRSAAELLQDAREQERGGRFAQAMVCYEAAIATAEGGGELAVLAEAPRRLAILRQQRDESTQARELCDRSYDVARAIGDDGLAAEALNTLGGLHLTTGSPVEARHAFVRALELGGSRRDLNARVHQNLGILANIQGDLEEPRFEGARQDGEASLALFDRLGARGPKADAYRVIGTVYRETGRPALAESRLRAAMDLAATTGSVLGEAEASRELALLYQSMGRNQEALTFLNRAYRLFRRLDARAALRPGDRGDADAPGLGRRAPRGRRIPLGPEAHHPLAPRALRRHRLSRPAGGRRDSALRTDRGDRRHVRSPHAPNVRRSQLH